MFPKCTRSQGFSRHTFPAHFVGFLFSYFSCFILFDLLLHENEGLHCFSYSSGIYFCGLLAIQSKKIAKFLRKSERWLHKWSKVKTLENKPRSGWPFSFDKLCDKCYRKSCKYMRNNSTKLEGKKNYLSQYGSKFRAQRYRDKLSKTLESLEEKKAVHTSCRHGVRRICKLYTKERPSSKLRWCELPRDHLDYR